jgi:hypothetical protein
LNIGASLHIDRIETRAITSEEFKYMLEQDYMVRDMLLVNKRDLTDIKRVKQVTLNGANYEI